MTIPYSDISRGLIVLVMIMLIMVLLWWVNTEVKALHSEYSKMHSILNTLMATRQESHQQPEFLHKQNLQQKIITPNTPTPPQ